MDKTLDTVIKAAWAVVVVTIAATAISPYWMRWKRKAALRSKLKVVKTELDDLKERERLERMYAEMDKVRVSVGLKPIGDTN